MHHSPSVATFHSTAIIQRIGVPLKMSFHFFIMDYLISFVAPKWSNECLGSIKKKSKQKGGRVEKTKRRERGKGKRIVES